MKIMQNKLWLAIGSCLATAACSMFSPDAQSVLQGAQKTMGSVKSIQYSATGMNAFFGQALTAGKEWPRRDKDNQQHLLRYHQVQHLKEADSQSRSIQTTGLTGSSHWQRLARLLPP